ncbi:unnamed protein product [Ilex paraguariensis]|uniref:EF-hand domain-containing protein n=1 Tax=Ilex paraguariensis TaxID=185542 RepID=A0ABC8S6J5_9AQUA
MTRLITFSLLFLLQLTQLGYSQSIAENPNFMSSALDNTSCISSIVELSLSAPTTSVTCEPTYGFLPCTTTLWGQLFLVVVYEYLLSVGERYVSAGSDLFFEMVGPGVFGASLFHLLGAVPEVLLVLISGLSGSIETAQEQAAMGMSVLAGSTVMLLTLTWGFCVAFGSYDFSDDSAESDTEHDIPLSLTGFGVNADVETSYTARIMILSMLPFIILQLANFLNSSSATRVIVLVALIVTLALFFAFSFYQVFQPWIQNRRFKYLVQKFVKDKLMGVLLRNGKPNIQRIKKIFHDIDKNKSGYISEAEMKMFIFGIQLEDDVLLNKDDYVEKVMEAFDINSDGHIDEDEFVKGLTKWLLEAKQSARNQDHKNSVLLGNSVKNSEDPEKQSLLHKSEKSSTRPWWNYIKALFLVLLGITILALLVRPLIEAVAGFATSANIPSFFVPYVVIPLAMNYRRALSAINSARQKTQTSISLTLSQIYGGAFMNNMIGLVVFLSLVYIRDLAWDVSAEVLVVLIICTVMGLFASFCTKFPLWTSFLAYLLYAISLLLLYVLTSVLGWS